MHAKDMLGKSGEQAAAEYLESCGLRIPGPQLALRRRARSTSWPSSGTPWWWPRSRPGPACRYGSPLEAVNRAKRARLRRPGGAVAETPTVFGSIRVPHRRGWGLVYDGNWRVQH